MRKNGKKKINGRDIFFIFLMALFSYFLPQKNSLFAEDRSWQEQIREIDAMIEDLEEQKRGYEGRALRQENQAQRLQFSDQEYLTAKRYWQQADQNRAKAKAVQEKIDRLKIEKQKILKDHGIYTETSFI